MSSKLSLTRFLKDSLWYFLSYNDKTCQISYRPWVLQGIHSITKRNGMFLVFKSNEATLFALSNARKGPEK